MGQLRKDNNILWIIVILFIVVLGITHCKSQNNVSLSFYQDLKLATVGDSRGNDAFTTDVTAKLHLNGFEVLSDSKFVGYVSLGPTVEYAQLQGGDYTRFGIEANYTFTTFDKVYITPIVSWGWIHRKTPALGSNKFSVQSWEAGFNISIPITPLIRGKLLSTFTDRQDLKALWGNSNIVSSFAVGLEILFAKASK